VNHNDAHHQHRKEEHELLRKEKHHHEQHPDQLRPLVHPTWFLVLGTVMTLLVVLAWTFMV
jgi:hypothetical protein